MQEDIIAYLKAAKGFISGEEISRALNISRAAIWKNIEEMRKIGYVIEAQSHLGYRLKSLPDKLIPWEIKDKLNTKIFGKKILCFENVNSTMDQAFALAMEEEAEGTLICAESQTKGRGRMGRSWVSPKGKGIYASLILRPKFAVSEIAKMTLLSAVAISEALEKTTELKLQIKWPNDILINGKKAAGILTEMNAELDRVKFVIIGFGINVNTAANHLPQGATSLRIETGKKFSRIAILQEILRSFEMWYERLYKEGFDPALSRWKEMSFTLGKRIQFKEASQSLFGEAVDLADDGGLLIKDLKGNIVKKMSGDVILAGGKA